MTPQISVFPSRALAVKTSGGFQPALRSPLMSAFSTVMTTDRSAVLRTTVVGARSTRDQVSTR
jgi:hypothetical protein